MLSAIGHLLRDVLALLLVAGRVGGLLLVDALLLIGGGTLLLGNLPVDLFALLLVDCG